MCDGIGIIIVIFFGILSTVLYLLPPEEIEYIGEHNWPVK